MAENSQKAVETCLQCPTRSAGPAYVLRHLLGYDPWPFYNYEFCLFKDGESGLEGCVKIQIRPERRVQISDLAAIALSTKLYYKRAMICAVRKLKVCMVSIELILSNE